MKKHFCVISLVVSLFLFVQYLYSHWPTLEIKREIFYERAHYSKPINITYCETGKINLQEFTFINYDFKIATTSEWAYPCYNENKIRHWKNLIK
jgi:hypothetical protein